jgi:integrase/recombinase XerD
MPKNSKNDTLDYQIDDFMMYCQQKDLRIKTISSYESTLRLFSRYMQDKNNISKGQDITEGIIREYIEYTKNRGKYTFVADKNSLTLNYPQNRTDYNKKVSTTTVNNYIRNLKVFFNFLEEQNIIKKSPMKKIKQYKNSRKPKESITDQEFKRLLQNIDTTKFHEYRDSIVIQLIYDSGMRLNECLLTQIENIDLDRRAIFISSDIAKGRKDRYVFFSNAMSRQLKRWINYKDRYVESDLLFCTKHATPMGVTNFERNFRVYCERIGLKNITAHGLRNAFGRNFLLSSGDIYTLSRLLGHSSVSVTEKAYADLTDDDIRNVYNKYSPIDRIKGGKR